MFSAIVQLCSEEKATCNVTGIASGAPCPRPPPLPPLIPTLTTAEKHFLIGFEAETRDRHKNIMQRHLNAWKWNHDVDQWGAWDGPEYE